MKAQTKTGIQNSQHARHRVNTTVSRVTEICSLAPATGYQLLPTIDRRPQQVAAGSYG